MSEEELSRARTTLNAVFTPATPVEQRRFFAGRVPQVAAVIDAADETGKHAVIYGERGVGKTSLSNILSALLPKSHVVRIAADTLSDYDVLWRKILRGLKVSGQQKGIGFAAGSNSVEYSLEQALPTDTKASTDLVVRTLEDFHLAGIFIVDEFDRVQDARTKTMIADTIKSISDLSLPVTLVIVGVAKTVVDLIGEHPSIERNLKQINLPRMSPEELGEIIDNGLKELHMTIDPTTKHIITKISQGFPHYTHLLAKYAAEQALTAKRLDIRGSDLRPAIEQAVMDTQESIRAAYHKAIIATRKDTLFPSVLLAAALVQEDEFGTFRASDLLPTLRHLTNNPAMDLPAFIYHLGKLTTAERGALFEQLGTDKRHRYRFSNPLMKPFIIMKGFSDGAVPEELLGDIIK